MCDLCLSFYRQYCINHINYVCHSFATKLNNVLNNFRYLKYKIHLFQCCLQQHCYSHQPGICLKSLSLNVLLWKLSTKAWKSNSGCSGVLKLGHVFFECMTQTSLQLNCWIIKGSIFNSSLRQITFALFSWETSPFVWFLCFISAGAFPFLFFFWSFPWTFRQTQSLTDFLFTLTVCHVSAFVRFVRSKFSTRRSQKILLPHCSSQITASCLPLILSVLFGSEFEYDMY